MLEVRVEQGGSTGQAGRAGKSHGAVSAKMNFLWAALCPQNTSLDVEKGRLPFLLDVEFSLGNTNTIPASPQLPGMLLNMKTLHKSGPWMPTSNPEFSFSEFCVPQEPFLLSATLPSTHCNLNFPHPKQLTELIQMPEKQRQAINFHHLQRQSYFSL